MVALRHCLGLLSALYLAQGCVTDDEDRACTLIGCGPLRSETLVLDADAGELTIEACFNDDCDSAPLTTPGASLELMGQKLVVSASMQTSEDEGQAYVSWDAAPSLSVAKGDRYAVRVTTAEGETVAESVVLAEEYTRSYPNGKECDGDGCLQLSAKPAP
jgi:hypothetical protein